MANGGTTLRVALGDYPHTLPLKRGAITSPWLKLEFVEVEPCTRPSNRWSVSMLLMPARWRS